MPLLEPITFLSAPVRRDNTTRPEKAEDMISPSPDAQLVVHGPQAMVMPSSINSLSRSDPPTPPRGPPPTPPRRAHNELSRTDPPTPPGGPPPTPRRRDADTFNSLPHHGPPNGSPPTPLRYEADIFNSRSRRDPPSPPSGPPPTPERIDSFGGFNSLSRKDPPTPPGGPPPSPRRRGIFNDLSRRDPPTPPGGPPPSPSRRHGVPYTVLSWSDLPSPPQDPSPRAHSTWTPDETGLLKFVCRSGVKLGWYQIAGLFHGKSVDECRSKCREIQVSGEALLDQQEQGCDSDDSKRYCEAAGVRIPTDDPVPGLSRGPSPVGSPVQDDRLTIRSYELNSDVECAVSFEMPKKREIITHLSDELNFVLEKDYDNVMDRVLEQHAFSPYPTGPYWTTAPSFLQMSQ